MGKSILDIIAENERNRIKSKNLDIPTDDVSKSPFKEYSNGYGVFSNVDYSNDVNKESLSVSEVGDKALNDLKDYNVFPQKNYDRVSTDLNDASVIDMPEIDEISEGIYINNIKYNKFASLDYEYYKTETPQGVKNQSKSYGEYIDKIKKELEIKDVLLPDVLRGVFNFNDSPIGEIGRKALTDLISIQKETVLKRKTLGLLNTSPFSVIQNKSLTRLDYDITVPSTSRGSTADFISSLFTFQVPVSYLPKDLWGLERTTFVKDGKVTYVGNNMTFEEHTELLLQYTGKGQEVNLFNLIKLNLYRPKMVGTDETLTDNSYISYLGGTVKTIDSKDFVVSLGVSKDTGDGYYEPYGVESIHKLSKVGKLISDQFAWNWISDVTNDDAIGWTKNVSIPLAGLVPSRNNFNPKSLLFKTQEIITNSSDSFLDMNAKEFNENINGEKRTISRGDATTASGLYVDDDGTVIQSGEYFRVWTKKRGYNRLDRTLRHRSLDNGDKRSVLNDNGLVNFAPTTRKASSKNGLVTDDVIKRYMFSIENLAWNDHMNDLPECEQGVGDPVTGTRGRIMWFPPYNLKITESVEANWKDTDFIGRGEPIWTYNNTRRSGQLSWTIIVDHPDIVHRIVGEKSEYWERYFKGDKLIQEDAKARQLINKKLSQNEIDELDKQRKLIQPIVKKDDVPRVTEKQKENNDIEKINNKEDNGELGLKVSQIYFPNQVVDVPFPAIILNDNNEVVFRAYENGLLNNNAGYETPDKFSPEFYSERANNNLNLNVGRNLNISITTRGGLRYRGSIDNQVYTYVKGKLRTPASITNKKDSKACPNGYTDNTNFGLNEQWYNDCNYILAGKNLSSNNTLNTNDSNLNFEKLNIVKNLIKSGSGNSTVFYEKAKITFIGHASAATTSTKSNKTLSEERAENSKIFFEKTFLPVLRAAGVTTEFTIETDSKGDYEDKGKTYFEGESFCQECDQPDLLPCKSTRRVDVWVKILDDVTEEEVNPDEDDKSIEDVETSEDLTLNQNQIDTDPDDIDTNPDIDPEILKKLVYTECDFFQYLEINEPLVYQTISEKIKYFWAAYHSITPQGFNSRLTFLQQCLRQGDSIGRDGVDNWKNLAFGRPPVCILRIGDFYHTRIIIKSMNIDYGDNTMWDLNPEGIGVQPMLVNISLNIEIIGGSSMTAPINRLQNAMSFNYYANTEMYDGRADSVVFIDQADGEGNSNDTTTFGTLKNGKIIDGIKLSSIINNSKSQEQSKLARQRKESRITLSNSTTATVNTQSLGEVGSLLEMKKTLGLSLTGDEKRTVKVGEVTKTRFNTTVIEPITASEVKNSSIDALNQQNSLLNQQAFLLNEGKTDQQAFNNYYSQWMNATVTDPNNLEEQYLNQSAIEYIEANRQIYYDDAGNFRDYIN